MEHYYEKQFGKKNTSIRIPAQTEDENADKLKLNEYIDWLGIHAKRWGVRKAFLRYLRPGHRHVYHCLLPLPSPEHSSPDDDLAMDLAFSFFLSLFCSFLMFSAASCVSFALAVA